jgi:hypothetical protein
MVKPPVKAGRLLAPGESTVDGQPLNTQSKLHTWSMATSGADLLEVPTIYRAYVGLCKRRHTQNMALYCTVPPF